MAKKRSSVFNTPITEQEIKKDAKAIETKALTGKEEAAKSARPKYFYISSEHHHKAKIQAAKKGMNLRQYAEWLIDEDAT